MTIRNAAKALVVHENKLLLVKYRGRAGEDCYTIPGGGQECLETMEEAIVRECLEETGYQVAVSDFAALYEEIIWDKAYQERYPDYAHKIFHIFLCRLRNLQPQKLTGEDMGQTGCEWVHLERVSSLNLYPPALRENITTLLRGKGPMFLGTRKIPFAQ
jgi:ADP-ribose pyrophosphatase YjhB (NUDIX family)